MDFQYMLDDIYKKDIVISLNAYFARHVDNVLAVATSDDFEIVNNDDENDNDNDSIGSFDG